MEELRICNRDDKHVLATLDLLFVILCSISEDQMSSHEDLSLIPLPESYLGRFCINNNLARTVLESVFSACRVTKLCYFLLLLNLLRDSILLFGYFFFLQAHFSRGLVKRSNQGSSCIYSERFQSVRLYSK